MTTDIGIVTMFHMLEPVLQDLYNLRNKTEDKSKLEKIQKWIDTLQDQPTLEEFKKILEELKDVH